jgi:tetratricopeptide (TPR) repeat protein
MEYKLFEIIKLFDDLPIDNIKNDIRDILQKNGYKELKEYFLYRKSFKYKNIKRYDDSVNYYLGIVYHFVEDKYDDAVKFYLMAIDKEHSGAMYNLANFYFNIDRNYDYAVKYYLMAVNKGNFRAMYKLGYYYHLLAKNYDEAKKYYLMAIPYGCSHAMNNLGHYYHNIEKNYEKAIKYYFMAINNGHSGAIYNLANFYNFSENNYDNAEKYYLMAINNGFSSVSIDLENMKKKIKRDKIISIFDYVHDIKKTERGVQNECQYFMCKKNSKIIINLNCQNKNRHLFCRQCLLDFYEINQSTHMTCLLCDYPIDIDNVVLLI